MALDNGTIGLLAIGQPTFDGSVHQYPYSDLDYVPSGRRHGKLDLQPKNQVDWLIDYRQTGVGGDNSWGARPIFNTPSLEILLTTNIIFTLGPL
ncbi:MAG: hypothetical protein CM1200mP10_07230 [Candidatus Neomarinimicrobiota bacterium]|nr:MAG: hypothetical protein CM1200mP10_07230 [Candidatus Neomarinimicrobiota bacterium]